MGLGDGFTIDFGTSSLIALTQQGIAHNSIDAILLTHLHGDHCGGVPFLLVDAMLAAKRTRPLLIAGPTGTQARMQAICEALFPGMHVMTPAFPLTYLEWDVGQPQQVLDLVVTRTRLATRGRPTRPHSASTSLAKWSPTRAMVNGPQSWPSSAKTPICSLLRVTSIANPSSGT
jgi:hypothetical protein